MSDEIKPMIIGAPTGTVEAVMRAIEHSMHVQVGIPAHIMGEPLPDKVDLRDSIGKLPLYEYLQNPDLFPDSWECGGERPSIRTQAEMMGMRVFNNRKRMRKRVRQRRRHFDPYEEHWTNNPNGDW